MHGGRSLKDLSIDTYIVNDLFGLLVLTHLGHINLISWFSDYYFLNFKMHAAGYLLIVREKTGAAGLLNISLGKRACGRFIIYYY